MSKLIFLSAVTAEFASYRDALRRDLEQPNVSVKVQEDFIATGTETLDKLDTYIRGCDAIIHLVGDMTGALAQAPSVAVIRRRYPDFGRRLPLLDPLLQADAPSLSYTQWEAWLALYHGKRLIIGVPEVEAPRDKPYRLDPSEQAAQQEHLSRLSKVERYPEIRFSNADRLAVSVLRSGVQEVVRAVAPPLALAVAPPTRDQWFIAHPCGASEFTGRATERAMLSDWLSNDATNRLLILRALGGFGKSALTWHWLLHDVDPVKWPRVVWWSFYESDASFDTFLTRATRYLHVHDERPLSASREELEVLLRELRSPGTLVVLDGFERALRAFGGLDAPYRADEGVDPAANERDCLSPLADIFLRSVANLPNFLGKVLITTRIRPAAIESRAGQLVKGSCERELLQLHPDEAVELLRAYGIRGSRSEIESTGELCGYHPLSLQLIAGLIVGDLQQPGDIAVARQLEVSGDLIQRRHHVLQQAYDSLKPERQQLLSRIACFRSAVTYDALKALAGVQSSNAGVAVAGEGSLEADIRDLLARGLLQRHLKGNRFDLHPIVRRYAYNRIADQDRLTVHEHLRDYFAAVPPPISVVNQADLMPVIELFHHTARAGHYDTADRLFHQRLWPALSALGAYQLAIDLLRSFFPHGEDNPPKTEDEFRVVAELGDCYRVVGDPRRGLSLIERARAVAETQPLTVGERFMAFDGSTYAVRKERRLGSILFRLALAQTVTGALRSAEANMNRALGILVDNNDRDGVSACHQNLGMLWAIRGDWRRSKEELTTALSALIGDDALDGLCVCWSYRAMRELLWLRVAASNGRNVRAAVGRRVGSSARRILETADALARAKGDAGRFYIRGHWLLGASFRCTGELDKADSHLNEALRRCRRTNTIDHESYILVEAVRLRLDRGELDDAQRLAEEGVLITDRCGYVLQGADAHLALAESATARGDLRAAREAAAEALRLAACDGQPGYRYQAAYIEATAMLSKLTTSNP